MHAVPSGTADRPGPTSLGLTEVLYPEDSEGLPSEEHTLADYLQEAGYYTASIGKWHLGRPEDHGPTRHGFEHSFGIDAVYSANRYPIAVRRDDEVSAASRTTPTSPC